MRGRHRIAAWEPGEPGRSPDRPGLRGLPVPAIAGDGRWGDVRLVQAARWVRALRIVYRRRAGAARTGASFLVDGPRGAVTGDYGSPG